MRTHLLAAVVAASASLPGPACAQVPAHELMQAPPHATRYLLMSDAGRHGTAAVWRDSAGRVLSRESMLLRGMVWEQDQVIRIGANGLPAHLLVRGVNPAGDGAEVFTLDDGRARWKSAVDSGSVATDGNALYVPFGTWTGIAPIAEALHAAPTRTLSLLPGGVARLTPLTEATIGEGAARKTVSAYAIEGLMLSPVAVWMEGDRFFAQVSMVSLVPEQYADALSILQRSQDEALAARELEIARRLNRLPETPVAFTHVRLYDAEGARFVDDQTVVVEGARITAVGAAAAVRIPARARVIDGTGKTLVPGLWDAHGHIVESAQGPMLLSIGVTSVRDPGSAPTRTVDRAKRIARGELLSPTVYSSLLIDGRGPLQAQVGVGVSSAEETVDAVRSAARDGLTGVKFYTSMQRDWLRAGIAEAKRLGLHVHGHVPAGMRPLEAIAAGYDEVTHINFVMMQAMPDTVVDQSNGMMRFEGPARYARHVDIAAEPLRGLIAEMARRRIFVDPTLSVFEAMYVPEHGDLSPAYAPFAGTIPPAMERFARLGGFAVPADLTRADYRASFARLASLVSALHRAGVPIVAGTDGLGLEIVRELELYVAAGLSPAEALQTATLTPAQLVKADAQTGSIRPGKQADMVLVDGDPSRRIGDLRRVAWVMSDGVLMNADELRDVAGFVRTVHQTRTP